MSTRDENVTASFKVTSFINRNRIAIIGVLICFCIAIVGIIVSSKIISSTKDKSLSKIEEIYFTLCDGSSTLEVEEIEARQNDALEALSSYTSKGGIVGARANLLCADISYQMEKYEDAANYYNAVAKKAKGNYLYAIAMYNLGVMNEQLGKTQEASENYKNAFEAKDCLFKSHAGFSYGRTLEALENYADAVAVYQKVIDANPTESWAKLSKTRVIALQAEKKAE